MADTCNVDRICCRRALDVMRIVDSLNTLSDLHVHRLAAAAIEYSNLEASERERVPFLDAIDTINNEIGFLDEPTVLAIADYVDGIVGERDVVKGLPSLKLIDNVYHAQED